MTYLEYLNKEIRPLVIRRAFIFFITKSLEETRGFPFQEDRFIFDRLWRKCEMPALVDNVLATILDGKINEVKPNSINAKRHAYIERIRDENPIFSQMSQGMANIVLSDILEWDEQHQRYVNQMEEGIRQDLRFMLMREMVRYN